MTSSNASNTTEYSQVARVKNCSVLGFIWLTNTDLVFITDAGLELYSVNQDKRSVKFVRQVAEHVSWYGHVAPGHVILTSATAETDQVEVQNMVTALQSSSIKLRIRPGKSVFVPAKTRFKGKNSLQQWIMHCYAC